MVSIFEWIVDNKEWLFSGIGIAAVAAFWHLITRRKKPRQPPRSHPVPSQSPSRISWRGVEIRGRYFAWDGPAPRNTPTGLPENRSNSKHLTLRGKHCGSLQSAFEALSVC